MTFAEFESQVYLRVFHVHPDFEKVPQSEIVDLSACCEPGDTILAVGTYTDPIRNTSHTATLTIKYDPTEETMTSAFIRRWLAFDLFNRIRAA